MQLTKGAIGNLINRYKAVLKKCHLLNVFGSLAVAGMLIMGGAAAAGAASWMQADGATGTWTNGVVPNNTVLNGTYDEFTQAESPLAGVATVDYTTTGVSVADGTIFKNNSKTAGAAGALKIMNGIKIGNNVEFVNNEAESPAWGGGALYIKLVKPSDAGNPATPSANREVTIGANAVFTGNKASSLGGAIALEYGRLTIKEEALFENNEAATGGAIAMWHDASTNGETSESLLNISNAAFIDNKATIDGGALFLADKAGGKVTLVGNSFTGNSATENGGAIFTGGMLSVENTTFDNNTAGLVGGAITSTTTPTASMTISGSTFTNNHSVYDGGAIGNYSGMIITNSTFKNNTAQLNMADDGTWTESVEDSTAVGGGAISLGAVSSSAVASISNTTFKDNISGTHGGAIATRMGKDANNSAAKLDIDATFIGNKAQQGGAIYNTFYTNNGLGKGDGVTVAGDFQQNKASDKGGAIFNDGARDKSDANGGIMTVSNSKFDGNTAKAGGAIYNTGTLTFTGTNTFTRNTAQQYGGAIFTDGMLSVENTTFDNNTAGLVGGAITSTTTPTASMTISGSTFTNNHSVYDGGAIGNYSGMIITNSTFENNTAQLNMADDGTWTESVEDSTAVGGGAISLGAVSSSAVASISNTTFKNNISGTHGGAIATRMGKDANNSAAKLDIDATFIGNKAQQGGAIYNTFYTNNGLGKGDGVTVAGDFQKNTASDKGGAIFNDGAQDKSGANGGIMTITDATFDGNKADFGGAIYNTGTLTFTGTNTFTNNTAAGKANDIYNAGTITVAGGTTTLNSGLILAENGTVKVTGGTLDMASGSTLDMGNGTLTINGGTFVADAGLLIKSDTTTGSYVANDANKVTQDNIVGTKGNLNLRWFDGDYTEDEYTSVKNALLLNPSNPSSENAELTLLNATLNVEDGKTLVAGATYSNGTATLDTGAKVVPNNNPVSAGTDVPHTPENYVSVVDSSDASTLLEVSAIATSGNSITAKSLKVDGLPEGSKEVTLKVTPAGSDNSTLTLVGDSKADTGVIDKDGKALATKAEVAANNTLNMGLTGNTQDQGLTLTEADVTGTLNANGGVTGTSSEYTINALTMQNNSKVNVLNSTMQIGKFTATGGTMFVDPAYVKIDSMASPTFGTKLLVSTGSTVNIGGMSEADMRQAMEKAGMSVGPNFTVGANQSVLVLGQALTLGGGGQIVVDANVDPTGAIGGSSVPENAYFGQGSLLVVNGNTLNGATAAIDLSSATAKTLNVKNGAKLLIADAVAGQTYTVISGAINADATTGTAFDGGTYDSDTSTGWKGDNLLTSSDMLTLTSENGTVFMAKSEDAHTVFPNLSHELATAVNTLYGQKLNNVDADAMGVRFLSRATDNRFLGADKDAAASTIESAARIAFAGAVPQMTKMASDAGSNAVVNRLGFANPADGAQAMNAEGKIVDRNTTGFALWIAPLWQSQHGWGMEADNLDYGFNGNLGGVSLGADYTFENAIRAGITFNIGGGYAESSGGDLSSTDNRMNFWGLGAYAGWNYENFGVMADVSYTSTWNDLKQDVDSRMGMGDLEADVQASAISAGLRAEYKLETSVLDVIPHIGVRYMSLNTWGFDAESNGGTVLEGDGFHQDIWTFPVGVTFTKDFTLDSGWSFKPSIDFSVIPAAGDIKAKQDVAFTGLPGTYEVETQMMDYLTWQGGVGLEMGNDTMSFGVNYTLQAGQHTTGHGVFGSFRYEF